MPPTVFWYTRGRVTSCWSCLGVVVYSQYTCLTVHGATGDTVVALVDKGDTAVHD